MEWNQKLKVVFENGTSEVYSFENVYINLKDSIKSFIVTIENETNKNIVQYEII